VEGSGDGVGRAEATCEEKWKTTKKMIERIGEGANIF
jgi:hypothetical protein